MRVLVELIGVPVTEACELARLILAELADLRVGAPLLLHGEGPACWPVLREAARRGLATRIGLEDTLTGPDGEPVRSNAELVAMASAICAGS